MGKSEIHGFLLMFPSNQWIFLPISATTALWAGTGTGGGGQQLSLGRRPCGVQNSRLGGIESRSLRWEMNNHTGICLDVGFSCIYDLMRDSES